MSRWIQLAFAFGFWPSFGRQVRPVQLAFRSPPSPVMKCKERRWPRGEAEQRMHGELTSKRSHVMRDRGRRMQDWLEVLDSALCLADKLGHGVACNDASRLSQAELFPSLR